MVAPVHRPLGESATSRHRQFANFLSVASSILGGAILQVFLSPPSAVTADASADPAAFGWCVSLHACAVWQRSWQVSCVVAFCFVILSIIACATASIANKTSMSLAAAILFFFASFFATTVAVLSIVFLSFPKATCIATAALLVSLLPTSIVLGREGLIMGLDDVVLGPRLWHAAAAGDAAAVRRLLSWGANPNWGGHVPRSPPHDGSGKAYFLSDTADIHGVTPLHIAAHYGHLEVARELLLASPDIKLSARDSLGNTPLHVAAYNLDHEMLQLLVSKGGDCWAVSNDGWTPLLAGMESHVPLKEYPRTVQHAAEIWDQHIDEVNTDTSPDPHQCMRKLVVEQLLAFRSDDAINAISPRTRLTALQLAIKRKWAAIAGSLIDTGATADVVGTSQTTLGLACITPDEDDDFCFGNMVECLLIAGANVDWQGKEGETALHVCIDLLIAAAWKGAERTSYEHIIGCAMVLLEQCASIDVKNKDTETPLMRAVGAPMPLGAELTTMLLHFSPNLDAADSLGRTALDHAVDACNAESVALLLAAGANPNPPLPHVVALTKNYLTPLQRAAQNGSIAISRLLIQNGADVNAFPPVLPNEARLRAQANLLEVEDFDEFGHICPKMPPLMYAIADRHVEVVQLLLNNGASITETGNTNWDSPLEFARHVDDRVIIRLLERAGLEEPAQTGHRWVGLRTRRVRFARAARRSAGAAAPQGASIPGAEAAELPQLQQSEQAAQHQVIDINGELHDDLQGELQAGQQAQSAPRFSVFARLAQAAGWLMQPFRRSSSREPSPPLSPQPSQSHRAPLSRSASESDGSPCK